MKSFESLKTSRTIIRRLQTGDKAKLIELLCDTSVTRNMAFPEEMLTEEGISNLIDMTIASYDSEKPLWSFAITSDPNGFIGVTGFAPLENGEIEVFYALLPEHWGKGLATEILGSLTKYVFSKTQYNTVVAPITQNNQGSIKVAEKNGYKNCGLEENPNYKDLIFVFKKKKAL